MAKSDSSSGQYPPPPPLEHDQKALIAALTQAILGSRRDRSDPSEEAIDAGIEYRAIKASLETASERVLRDSEPVKDSGAKAKG